MIMKDMLMIDMIMIDMIMIDNKYSNPYRFIYFL